MHKKVQQTVDELCLQFKLTERERDLLPYFLSALVYEDIAKAANISIKTIKNHAASIYRKLKVKHRQKLMVLVLDRILEQQEGEK